jgi:hypothetical protein
MSDSYELKNKHFLSLPRKYPQQNCMLQFVLFNECFKNQT